MTLELLLRELLGEYFESISDLSLRFIDVKWKEEDVRNIFYFLRNVGISLQIIAQHAHLFRMTYETIKNRYDFLINLGIIFKLHIKIIRGDFSFKYEIATTENSVISNNFSYSYIVLFNKIN